MDGYVSKSQFALIYGCSKPYVSQLLKEKRLVLSQDGRLVNVDASLRLLKVTEDPSKAGVKARWEAVRAGKDPAAAMESERSAVQPVQTALLVEPPVGMPVDGQAGSSSGGAAARPSSGAAQALAAPPSAQGPQKGGPAAESEYHLARTKREQIEAQLAELELGKQMGALLEAEPVLRAVLTVNTAAREALLGLKDRLTPLVAPETDARKVYELIEAECERIGQALAAKLAELAATTTTKVS